MRVRSITITALFGMFNHRIPLFPSDPITIIHGPNGIGKTSILRLIYGTLKPDYSHIRQIPFEEIEIQLDDGRAVVAQLASEDAAVSERIRRTGRVQKLVRPVHIRLKESGRVKQDFEYVQPELTPRILQRLDDFVPYLHRVGPREWHDARLEETLTFDEVLHHYGDELPEEFRQHGEPEWLREIQEAIPIHFIETQRLLDVRHRNRFDQPHRPHDESAVKRCSDHLAARIQSKLAESATISQSLERSFPTRVISSTGPQPLSEQEIREDLASIDDSRARLVEASLLDRGFEPPLPGEEFDDTTKRVLTVYVQDTRKKLAVFDDFLSRLELMKRIVNSRFLYKTLNVDRSQGFVITTREGRSVALSDLSSGEQHELVLLYELLFRAPENTFILIDEPELSLHIAWQQQFLSDLIEIARLAKLQALVATHSPQIIHDRWDLTVELTGPNT